ncbi:CHAT domain-containing protein [Haliscomenobacter hydrossis]|uniref:Tetratricopeptide TPR_1 repeat-containing protein n=1 Tax=Haliscomenobacter hydrossis (strain ATCC 27775 / DSM 1100 / LMG 10767 / O) TaxID=760192 RepID=F4KQW8_HALH1|nr:CHAT domain-containing tetratricopeptide repeat protein [Haliscomenobacter hydrossis]AEE52253.1 Tetratricopeptide TPR_1 repeat-containing protein [Haliscomenobacter hydrossis DSM 1100]
MRNYLCLALCLITGLLSAQTVDSVALRRVDSLIQVSRTLSSKREFDKALEVNAAAEKLALEKLGKESAAYGNCAFNRGRVNALKRDNSEAEKWYLEAIAIREKVLGKQHSDYAGALNNLAILYKSMGKYDQAEPLYLEAMETRKKALGKEHPNYAASLYNLALFFQDIGKYEKAELLLLEAKDIFGKVRGKEHPDYAASMNGLALIYMDMGKYENAEALYLEATTIREKVQGKDNSDYAESLNNLASLYRSMGNYEKAEQLHLQAIAIKGKILRKEHPSYALSLNNLAILYRAMGSYEKAEQLYLEATTIKEKTLGKEHPGYALSLNNLAILYWIMGNYEKAEPLYLQAIAIREKKLGKEHPEYASSLNNLALLYLDMGRYEMVESLQLQAKVIREKALGAAHPDFAESLGNLAILYMANNNYAKAESFYIECSQANQSLLEKAIRHLSERELGKYLNKFSESQDQALSFVKLSTSKEATAACFDNSLFYKGFLLQTGGQLKRLSLSDPTAAENFNLLKSYERRLATQYSQPIAQRDSAAIADLEAKANDLEKDLAQTVAGFGQALRQVKWQEVQTALKPGEAAIEFVSYRFYHKNKTDSTLYAALLLLPGKDSPKFIPLFEEKQLTALLKTDGSPQAPFYNDLYANDKKGEQLYDLIWKPISGALPQGATVYCSPSGLLHRLNLGAIPTPDGKTLAEKNRLSILGSTRQLVVPPLPTTQQSATAQLYGGIQYDATPTVAINTTAKPEDLAARSGPDITQNDSTLRGENWNYLRWTEVEISAAANVMKSKGIVSNLKKGSEATEESFKALGEGSPSPRILHVATHGFFFPDPKELKPGEGQAIGEKTFKVSDNPMIRSGLLLAGGNHAWKTGNPLRPELEDGILTAYEISQMNLSNTELVVLSACETGLGDLVGNEGVYGLQRAFKIAGAKYLIMSLWQVPDFQTQVFMTAFYKHWLEGKMAVPEAFRATQAELRGKYSGEAFKWAGFVLVE